MRRSALLWIAWSGFALAWVVPVHKYGVTLPRGLSGWEAFRIAFAPVWPLEGVKHETWWAAILSTLSATTNFLMLGSLWPATRRRTVSRLAAVVAFAAFVVNAQWLILETDWADFRAGYYLWWLSFLVLSAGLFRISAGESGRPIEAAA